MSNPSPPDLLTDEEALSLAAGPQDRLRLLRVIEANFKLMLAWTATQPLSDAMMVEAKAQATNFLTQLWKHGSLFGATAQEAFEVTCDASNNPASGPLALVLRLDTALALDAPGKLIAVPFQFPVARS